jgi:hypothetical protein
VSDGAAFALALGGLLVAYLIVDGLTPPRAAQPAPSAHPGGFADAVAAIRALETLYGKDDEKAQDGATAGAVAAGQDGETLTDKALALWGKLTDGIDKLNASQDKGA